VRSYLKKKGRKERGKKGRGEWREDENEENSSMLSPFKYNTCYLF
jgi:hypothetical protein